MFPFDSTGDVAAQTRAKLAAPQTNTPGQRLSKWATTPIGLQNSVKTPTQVMQPAIKTEAPKPAATAGPDFSEMIKRGGGNPNAFHNEGSQLVSSRSPQEIQADISAHPPITTDAGRALIQPSAPVASVPTVGVQGAPAQASAAAQARPGVQQQAATQVDPTRAAMERNYRLMANGGFRSGPNSVTYLNQADFTPEQYSAHHGALAAHANSLANYNQTDPGAQIGLLKGIAGDKGARDLYLGGKGHTAAEINAMPQPGLQVDPSTGQDVNQWTQAHARAGTPLQEVLGSMPFDQSPQVQAALQAHINKQYADPKAWESEVSQSPGFDQYQYSGALPGLFSGPARAAAYFLDRTPAGFASERNFNPQVHGLMNRYGLKPPSHGLTSADSGVGNPY